jgi:hypothetical protein
MGKKEIENLEKGLCPHGKGRSDICWDCERIQFRIMKQRWNPKVKKDLL